MCPGRRVSRESTAGRRDCSGFSWNGVPSLVIGLDGLHAGQEPVAPLLAGDHWDGWEAEDSIRAAVQDLKNKLNGAKPITETKREGEPVG